jgi:hypothetical protein
MVLPPHALRQRKQGKINKDKEAKRNFISASLESCNLLPAMFACRDYNSLHHILALIGSEGVPALDCLPSNDMALKRNKMSAGVKQQ